MKEYPKVLTEDATLDAALAGVSLARFGDGELSLILGGDCISQKHDPRLAADLAAILRKPQDGLLVCIPNALAPGTKAAWAKYATERYFRLYGFPLYGSAFITRPDSAPWIDRPDYWAKAARLWRERRVILVSGTGRSLRAADLLADGARAVTEIRAPERDAWGTAVALQATAEAAHALEYRAWVGEPDTPPPIVLLCAGPAATVLAARLARVGIHAVDAGHLGMFMRHKGAYAIASGDLASPAYRAQLQAKHKAKRWGTGGRGWAGEVEAWAQATGSRTVLDYGCGRGTLAEALKGSALVDRVQGYDPGVPEFAADPKPADLLVSTDVLEHIEPDRLDFVLAHMAALTGRAAFLNIALTPAREILPDGRNAHLIVERPGWWLKRLAPYPWKIERHEQRKGLCVWLRK